MRILLLGAGTVGRWVADLLCQRGHSVTVVDADPQNVRQINLELDVRAVQGSASRSTVLFGADVCGADVCLALTGNDEVNLVGASLSKALGCRRVMARVFSPAFTDVNTFDYQSHFGIDALLSLEQLSAYELARSIRDPDAIPLEHLARGQLEVYEVEVHSRSTTVGKKIRKLELPAAVRIGSIRREGRVWIASAEDELRAEDRISLIGTPESISKVRPRFMGGTPRRNKQSVLIAGGGETGYHLANSLSTHDYRITLLEQASDRCDELSRILPEVDVLHANANRRDVLEDEGAGHVDHFVACTGSDENNIMAGVEARELGARRVLCVVGRSDYANVVGKLGIDRAVSERDAAGRQILGFLNEGAVISHHELPGKTIGVYELEVMQDAKVVNQPLCDLPFPGRCIIAAVQHAGFVQVPKADDHLEVGDIAVALIDQSASDEILSWF